MKYLIFIVFFICTAVRAQCVFKDQLIQNLKTDEISGCDIVFAQGFMKSFSDESKVYKRSFVFVRDEVTKELRPAIKKDLIELKDESFKQLKESLGNSLFNSEEFNKYKSPKDYFSQIWGYLDDNDFITPNMLSGFEISKTDQICKECTNDTKVFTFTPEMIKKNQSLKQNPEIHCVCSNRQELTSRIRLFESRQGKLD